MHRAFVTVLGSFVVSAAVALSAQPTPPAGQPPAAEGGAAKEATPIPAAAITGQKALTRERKARYLLQQLELNPEQKQHADGLLEMHFGPGAKPQIDIEEVRKLFKELEEAQKAGNKEEQQRLQEQMQQLGQRADQEDEFVADLQAVLEEPQKQMLKRARERLTRNPTGGIRPIDLLDEARALNPDEKVRERLERIEAEGRLQATSPGARFDDSDRVKLINDLVQRIYETLPPDQAKQFDQRVQRLRPDAIEGAPAETPAETPAQKAAKAKGEPSKQKAPAKKP